MEAQLDEYRDQIEYWQENICSITFDKSDCDEKDKNVTEEDK